MPYVDGVVFENTDRKNKEMLHCDSHLRVKIPGMTDSRGVYLGFDGPM